MNSDLSHIGGLMNTYRIHADFGTLRKTITYKSAPTIDMMRTPAGYVKIGDIVCYYCSDKHMRFGIVDKFDNETGLFLRHRYAVTFGDDSKQVVSKIAGDIWVESYYVCDII